jgi:predicted GTPase
MDRRRVIIMGAAGRDFHDFNVVYRNDPGVEVVAFTATQIPGIADRFYPAELAGPLYDEPIPIVAERELERLIRERHVDTVVLPTATSRTRP